MLKIFSSSKGVKWITVGWTAFIAENLILSENRESIINWKGENNYHAIYNTCSVLSCGTIAYGYLKYGHMKDPFPTWSKRSLLWILIGGLSQWIGAIGISQLFPKLQMPLKAISSDEDARKTENKDKYSFHFTAQCPFDFKPSISIDGIYGMERISRHSTLWSFGFLSLGHAFQTIYMPAIILGTFPIVFALIGGAHQDMRHRRGSGGYLSPEKDRLTSNVPFAALVSTTSSNWILLKNEIKWSNAALSVLYPAFIIFRKLRI